MRTPTGTRIEETARQADLVEQYVRKVIPNEELTGVLDKYRIALQRSQRFLQ
jgi:hypothetical protein